ncbi:MAG: class I SAM-dependent RNA methyltransferase [Chthoniobacterales bacterium]
MHVDLTITDIAFGGKGVARNQGKAIFVPFTIEGEQISANIAREKKHFAEGELLEVVAASPNRVAPECPYFGRCGGCSYQHISYEHQLEIKARQVEQAMRRIGRLAEPPMRPIIPSPRPYGYRNRITVHAQDNVVGFYRRDVHELIDIKVCPISVPEVNEALTRLRAGHVRDGHYTLRAQRGSRIFAQTNDDVAVAMADVVSASLASGGRLLIDAYCGSGFFAKRLVDRFDRVVGIDWDRFAIAAAKGNIRENEMYIAGDVGAELRLQLDQAELASTAVIVDPPATGLSPDVRQALLDLSPKSLIYVSCNPPTIARDIAALQRQFDVESITPADMFPQTAEIEVVAHMSARKVLA